MRFSRWPDGPIRCAASSVPLRPVERVWLDELGGDAGASLAFAGLLDSVRDARVHGASCSDSGIGPARSRAGGHGCQRDRAFEWPALTVAQ